MRIASEMEPSWRLCALGRIAEALDVAGSVADVAQDAGHVDVVAQAECLRAWFCFQLGKFEVGLKHANLARNLFVDLGDRDGECQARAVHAWLLNEVGLCDEAAQVAEDCVSFAKREGVGPKALSWACNVLAVICWGSKQLDIAQARSEEAVLLARSTADPVLLRWWLINLGGIHAETGYVALDRADAAAAASAIGVGLAINAEAILLSETAGDAWTLKLGLCNAVEYHLARDEPEAAEQMLGRSEAILPPGSRSLTHHLYNKGQLLARTGRLEEACAVCTESLAMAELEGDTDGQHHALRYLAEIHEGLGRYREALSYFKRYHDLQSRVTEERVRLRVRLADVRIETEGLRRAADHAKRCADEATQRSLTDPLTGVGNRRAFDDALAAMHAADDRVCIAIIDLDHFKRINDEHGHLVGDEVLRRVGAMLRGVLAPGDVATRLGGEEFALLLRGLDVAAAEAVCMRLKVRISSAGWAADAPGLEVTVSIGVAGATEAADAQGVWALADARLYAAKARGRDCVIGAGPGKGMRKDSSAA